MKKGLLSTLIKKGRDFHQIEAKTKQILNRTLLTKIKNGSKKPELVKVVELKEKDCKNLKYLFYRMNDRRINNSLTDVFKTSQTSLKIVSELNINFGHFMRNDFVNFNGNDKHVLKMTVLTLFVYQPLVRNQIPLDKMDCATETKRMHNYFKKHGAKQCRKPNLNLILLVSF